MIDLTVKSEVLEVSVQTEILGIGEAEQLRRRIRKLDGPEFEKVHIDLSGVESIQAAAVGALLSASRDLEASDKPVVLLRPRPAVRTLLDLMRLSDAFEIQGDERSDDEDVVTIAR